MMDQHTMLSAGVGTPPADGMVWIPGGTFRMGSDRHDPEEAPARVIATGYTTVAERPLDPTGMSHIGFRCAARGAAGPAVG